MASSRTCGPHAPERGWFGPCGQNIPPLARRVFAALVSALLVPPAPRTRKLITRLEPSLFPWGSVLLSNRIERLLCGDEFHV